MPQTERLYIVEARNVQSDPKYLNEKATSMC